VHDPASHRAAHHAAAYSIRVATLADLDALVALEHAAFNTDHLSRRQYRKHLASATARALVAVDGGGLLGKALVFFRHGSPIARLYSIAVADRGRGRGIAKALLAAVEQAARAHDCRVMRLEVSQSNPAAIALYERHGYRRFAERREYYENGEHAWLYEKQLGSSEG
jgi:ribosomal protein S18 acetylase RimI-like enzyme